MVAVLFTPVVSRTIRAAVLGERDLDYVTAARLRGESSFFIMFREILPNISAQIIVELTVRIGYAVFTVATLSFLGVGPPTTLARLGGTGGRELRRVVGGHLVADDLPGAGDRQPRGRGEPDGRRGAVCVGGMNR